MPRWTRAFAGDDPSKRWNHEVVERCRQLRPMTTHRVRSFPHDRGRGPERRLSCERMSSRQQLVEHHPEREDVRPPINQLAPRLLRRHVGHRTRHGSPLCQLGRRGCLPVRDAGHPPGEPKINHLHVPARRQYDVGRLEVAMDDARRVRRLERVGNLPGHGQRFTERDGSCREPRGERLPPRVLHGDERAYRPESPEPIPMPPGHLTVVVSLIRLPVDVLGHHLVRHGPRTTAEVAQRTQVSSPELFLQFRQRATPMPATLLASQSSPPVEPC